MDIKEKIEELYKKCIVHSELPYPFQVGANMFKVELESLFNEYSSLMCQEQKEEIKKMISDWWRFDDNQWPMASWHEKQDLLKKVNELSLPKDLSERYIVIEKQKMLDGYCVESKEGVIQYGTFSDRQERTKELFIDAYEIATGNNVKWEDFENDGCQVIPVKLIKL